MPGIGFIRFICPLNRKMCCGSGMGHCARGFAGSPGSGLWIVSTWIATLRGGLKGLLGLINQVHRSWGMMRILPKRSRPMSNEIFVICRKTEVELTSVMFKKVEEKKFCERRRRNSLRPCSLGGSEGTEEVFRPQSSIARFLPFLPLFFFRW